MASTSTNNTDMRVEPRYCKCGRVATMRVVQSNDNGNRGRAYFVCPKKYTRNEHCNYFTWFEDDDDDDDDDITSTIRATARPLTNSTTEEINDLRRRVGEHDRRLQRMEKIFKGMTYVIVFFVFLYFIM